MVEDITFLEFGNVEPHALLLKQPSDDRPLFKIMKVGDLILSVEQSYLHFQRVDSYKDFPTADAHDGEQPIRDRPGNTSATFEQAPNFSAANYYDTCRARTYACSFSLSNSPLIWNRYGVGDPVGKVGIVFDFGKLRAVLNRTIGNTAGQSALMVGNIQCKQIFYINFGVIDYVDASNVQLNLERLPNPVMYSYQKDRSEFAGEDELRVTLATLGLGSFALADNTTIDFPRSMQLSFNFRTAFADGTISRLIFENDEVGRHLTPELARFGVMVKTESC